MDETADRELRAMEDIVKALSQLDQSAQERVLNWLAKRFGSNVDTSLRSQDKHADANFTNRFDEFGDLFHSGAPAADKEKALLAAYWIQFVKGEESFGSQAINTRLKDLGYGVSNITAALSQLQEERPALAIQLKKSGTSQQARKTYKLTDAGRRRAEEMLRKPGDEHAKN